LCKSKENIFFIKLFSKKAIYYLNMFKPSTAQSAV
jgi:hypothetical protein